jgi:two-component sensor histidine kinase
MISLISLTHRRLADPQDRDQVGDLIRRVESFALLQERFYRPDDLRSIDIASFVVELVKEYDAAHPKVTYMVDVEPMSVSIQKAVPIGLIANELLMAIRGTDARDRLVRVGLRSTGAAHEFTVCDTAGGIPESSAEMGAELVSRLAGQLHATVVRQEAADGLLTQVSFPR